MKKLLFLSAMLIGMISFVKSSEASMMMAEVEKNMEKAEAVFFDSGGGGSGLPDLTVGMTTTPTMAKENAINGEEQSAIITAYSELDLGWMTSKMSSPTSTKEAACTKQNEHPTTSSSGEVDSGWLSLNKKVTTQEEAGAGKKEKSITSGGWVYQKAIIKSEHIQFG